MEVLTKTSMRPTDSQLLSDSSCKRCVWCVCMVCLYGVSVWCLYLSVLQKLDAEHNISKLEDLFLLTYMFVHCVTASFHKRILTYCVLPNNLFRLQARLISYWHSRHLKIEAYTYMTCLYSPDQLIVPVPT